MKKPGEFKKQKQKHKNVQHNRDQLKLLREDKIKEAELFVLDFDGFKKVKIETINNYYAALNNSVVYLNKKLGRLQTGLYLDQYSVQDLNGKQFKIPAEQIYGLVTNIEMMKPNENWTKSKD